MYCGHILLCGILHFIFLLKVFLCHCLLQKWSTSYSVVFQAFAELLESGRLKPTGTDVEPYTVDGRVYLAELSHGLKRHYYWTPSYGDPDNEVENASLAINPASEHL